MTYRLKPCDDRLPPWVYAAYGRDEPQPQVVEHFILWGFDRIRYVYGGRLYECLKSTWERDFEKVEDSK